MSTRLQPVHAAESVGRAEYLQRELVAFVTSGELKKEYQRQHDLFFDNVPPEDEHEAVSVLDWFLFDWLDDNGEGAIDHFLDARPDLTEADQELLLDWENSLNSVFEVRATGKKSLRIEELDSKESFQVLSSSPFKRGQFIMARLLPLCDQFMFSGLQFAMPDRESATAWLNMRRALDKLESPEALENAQRQQCNAFCELFGCDQLTVQPAELNATLGKFQNYLLVERRDPETGKTPAETFKAEFGHDLQVPDMPSLPQPIAGAGDVTILCDDFDGIVVLPDYNRFRRVFEAEDPSSEVPQWRELVWSYINDPDIPIVAFERVAEELPERVESVLRELLGDKNFSLEHLYAVLLHYKQPVEGLDDLDDDRQLWDLFNGNASSNQKPAKARSKANKKSAATRRSATAKKSTAGRAKKARIIVAKAHKSVAGKRAAARPKAKAKSKPAAKAAAGSKPPRRRVAGKSAQTRKR
ncbi:MAG TPA: hypothetical protein VNS63_06575 [Blastocatellia bacterium]|nr:hypothetical protein [Blastocatellia bacterium]